MTQDDFMMSSPPTEGEFVSGERSSWPTVVAVFGIIVAVLGYLGGCCGVASPFIMPWYIGMIENQPGVTTEQIDQIKAGIPPIGWAIGSGMIGLAMATLLLYGSIQLIKRRSKSRGLLLLWSWITVPWALVATMIQYMLSPTAPAQGVTAGQQQMMMMLTMGCGLVFSLALPVFLIIWFSRARIREEAASWDQQVYDPI